MNTIYIHENRSSQTDTLQQAVDSLDDCGGTIYIKKGLHYSGPLVLKSRTNLYLEREAEIRFIDDFSLYPPVYTRWEGTDCHALQSMVFAEDSSEIIISGEGTLNGMGRKWWSAYRSLKEGRYIPELEEVQKKLTPLNRGIKSDSGGGGRETNFLRPSLIQFKNCKNITIKGITVQDSPFWNTHILYSQAVTLKDIKFKNPPNAPNTDGLDIDSSQNVLVENCHFDVGDDCLCLKSGMDENGKDITRETSDITIRNCSMKNGHGAVVFGSETSGGIRNVSITDCTMEGTDRGIRVKTRRGRGGKIENIKIRNIEMTNVAAPIVFNMYYRCGADTKEIKKLRDPGLQPFNARTTPLIADISIENIQASGVNSSSAFFLGLPESPISNLQIRNYNCQTCQGGIIKEPAMDLFYTKPSGQELLYKNLVHQTFENITIDSKTDRILKELIIKEDIQC